MIRAAISILVLLCSGAVLADELQVEMIAVDGTVQRGQLLEPGPDLLLQVADETRRLDWSEVLELRPLEPREAPVLEDLPLEITLGDESRFRGKLLGAEGGTLELQIRSQQSVSLQVERVRSIRRLSGSDKARDMLARQLADGQRKEAVAIVERGSKLAEVRGTLLGVSSDSIRFKYKQRTLTIPWERLAGVLPAPPARRGAALMLHLRDGQQFAGQVSGGDARSILLRHALLGELAVAWSQVARVESRSRQVLFLSDAQIAGYEFEPLFTKRWTFARNEDLQGNPVAVGGRVYEKALVMHSRSTLRFRLGGRFSRFATLVGVLDAMQGRGDAQVFVLGDDQVLWESESVRGGEMPQTVSVEVRGVQELTLVVDYGADLDLSDHVAWVWPRLLR